MIKRDIVETIYEYDKEGKLLKKTVTETHEEDNNTSVSWRQYPNWISTTPYVTCDTNDPEAIKTTSDTLSSLNGACSEYPEAKL